MRHQDDPPITHTQADVTSETRFGPRPVPPGHRPRPGPAESRRIPPHGDLAPDGSRPWPRPSRGAKWLVLGGAGLAAAALTAGTVVAARHLFDRFSQDDSPSGWRGSLAPRYADLSPAEREAMRERMRSRDAETARAAQHIRAAAERDRQPRPAPRRPRQPLMKEIEANTASLTEGVENVMRAVESAVSGFRTVAGQASAIMREFGDAAALVRDIVDRKPASPQARSQNRETPRPGPRPAAAAMPDLHDDPLLDDGADAVPPGGPADQDPRIHRL